MFWFSIITVLHFMYHKIFVFLSLIQEKVWKTDRRWFSLKKESPDRRLRPSLSGNTHTHTHTHTHRPMHVDHHWKQMSSFSSVWPLLYSSPHKLSSTCITTGCSLIQTHNNHLDNIHAVMTPLQVTELTKKKLKKTSRGRLMKDLHSLVAVGADNMT